MAQPYTVNHDTGEIEPSQALTLVPPRVQLDKQKLAVIRATIAPALNNEELAFFGHVCQRMQLDPFARQIYAVKRGDKLTIQVGIDGFRALAERTGLYRGQLGPLWCGPDGEWRDCWLADEAPVAAKVGVLRADFSEPLWAVARTKAYRVDNNSLWQKMPEVMIAKCAEALALRKAFPDALGGAYEASEMDQADHPLPEHHSHVRSHVIVTDEAQYEMDQALAATQDAASDATPSAAKQAPKAAKPPASVNSAPTTAGEPPWLSLRARMRKLGITGMIAADDLCRTACGKTWADAHEQADYDKMDAAVAKLEAKRKQAEQALNKARGVSGDDTSGANDPSNRADFPMEDDAASAADDPDALTKLSAAPLQ